MTKVMRQAYAEVDEILKYMPKEYLDKVPIKFRKLFSECKLKNYTVKINPDKPLSEQPVIYDTLVIIAILKYNFWCETEEEKKKMMEQMKENESLDVEKYDIASLSLKNKIIKEYTSEAQQESNDILLPTKVEKLSWFSKFMHKIKGIFKR